MLDSANTLHDRIGQVVNTAALQRVLAEHDVDLIEFQCTWNKESSGDFDKLPEAYQQAILAGERETAGVGELVFA